MRFKTTALVLLFAISAMLFSSCAVSSEALDAARAGLERSVALRAEIDAAAKEVKQEMDSIKEDIDRNKLLVEKAKAEGASPAVLAEVASEIPRLVERYNELKALAENGEARKLIEGEIAVFKERMAEAERKQGELPPWLVAVLGVVGTIAGGAIPVLRTLRNKNEEIAVGKSAMRKTKASVATAGASVLPAIKTKQSATLDSKEEAFVKSA